MGFFFPPTEIYVFLQEHLERSTHNSNFKKVSLHNKKKKVTPTVTADSEILVSRGIARLIGRKRLHIKI